MRFFLIIIALLAVLGAFDFSLAPSYIQTQRKVSGQEFGGREERLKILFAHLKPKPGPSGLLLGFDTDNSDDAQSYAQFYDDFSKLPEKKATNKTRLFVRDGDKVEIAAKLDLIASPQKSGWLYLGQARYFEPRPRDKNKILDSREEKGDFKNFGFDYSRVWVTDNISKVEEARNEKVRRTKAEIDREYRKLKPSEREYHRNITDYEKIGWVSDGYFIKDGFWSLVHGGAAWFEASEHSELVNLGPRKLSGNLSSWFDYKKIVTTYSTEFDSNRRYGEDAKYNDMDSLWSRWKESFSGNDPDRIPTFTLERHEAKTRMIGRALVDGNTHRSFLGTADFGIAPPELARYDNPDLDFAAAKSIFPDLIDIFISPSQDTAFFLTAMEMIAIDTASGKELFRENHELKFNKVVMVEWAVGEHVGRWRKELSN
jgi:hypothetical protein